MITVVVFTFKRTDLLENCLKSIESEFVNEILLFNDDENTKLKSHQLNISKTLKNIIIPSATPGILTGLILAIARATGEVAPLMITGVVKLAPSMPIDGFFPYLHFERKFMHLGFNIYDVGFQ